MKTIEELLESFDGNDERLAHMEMLADAFFDHLNFDDSEFGGWGLDSKRPFGNSLVEPDIAEIIGWDRESVWDSNDDFDEDKVDYLRELYYDLGTYLPYRWKQLKGQ